MEISAYADNYNILKEMYDLNELDQLIIKQLQMKKTLIQMNGLKKEL